MTPYEEGFISKCAELGVDPEALVKQALSPGMLRRSLKWLRQLPGMLNRSAHVMPVNPTLGERLLSSGAVTHGTKSVEALLTSPEIGAFGPGFGGFPANNTFATQLARLRAARRGVDAGGIALPASLRGTASTEQYDLLQQIIQHAKRNALPGQVAADYPPGVPGTALIS